MSKRVFITDPARPFVCPEGSLHRTSALIGDDRIFEISAPDDFEDVTDELVGALIGLYEAGVESAFSEDPEDDPIEQVTFGQGSFGHRCRFCLADDYDGLIVHKPTCLWVREKNRPS